MGNDVDRISRICPKIFLILNIHSARIFYQYLLCMVRNDNSTMKGFPSDRQEGREGNNEKVDYMRWKTVAGRGEY